MYWYVFEQNIYVQVEVKLAFRLQAAIKEWMRALRGSNDFIEDQELALHRPGGLAEIKTIRVEFFIRNQVIDMKPPFEKCREHLYNEFALYLGVITSLTKIQSQRYQVGHL